MTVNVALVGLGYWGPNLARNLAVVPGARLHTLCDADPERLEKAGAEHPGARRRPDFRQVLEDSEVHAVVIATPPSTHADLARSALRAGKHALVEKPMARSAAECRELLELAEARRLTLMAGYVFLYNAAVRRVKEIIDAGELGRIYYVCSRRLNLGIVRRDVNALWNFAPHDLSILDDWLGSAPLGIAARGFAVLQPGIEDVVFATLDYAGGVGAHVHLSWLDPDKVRTMTVVGERKMLVYDDVASEAKIRIYDKGYSKEAPAPGESPLGRHKDFAEFRLLLRAGGVTTPKIDVPEPLQEECRHFVDCVRTGARPRSDGRMALRVIRGLEAAQRSLESNGTWKPVGP